VPGHFLTYQEVARPEESEGWDLWRAGGICGFYVPGLMPGGLGSGSEWVRDWSPYGHHGHIEVASGAVEWQPDGPELGVPGTGWSGLGHRLLHTAASSGSGTRHRVECGNWNITTGRITLLCRYRKDQDSTPHDWRAISKAETTTAADHDWMLGAVNSSGGVDIRTRLNISGTVQTDVSGTGDILNQKNWTNMGVTFDGANVRHYFNGAETVDSPFAHSGSLISNSTKPGPWLCSNPNVLTGYGTPHAWWAWFLIANQAWSLGMIQAFQADPLRLLRRRQRQFFKAGAAPAGFVPYPRPRGARAGMAELAGGMH
jgi:hypothetical protein